MSDINCLIDDRDAVLRRLGGSEALLERLLAKFKDSYAESGILLNSLLLEGNAEEAHRLVHSIKGVSANLGMGDLCRACLELEGAMSRGEETSSPQAAFERELARALALI
jgi:HPt (histidine-containing phosphotransfer) domain-containing protein